MAARPRSSVRVEGALHPDRRHASWLTSLASLNSPLIMLPGK